MTRRKSKVSFKQLSVVLIMLACCLFLGSGICVNAASAKSRAMKAYKNMLSSRKTLNKYTEFYDPMSTITFTTAYVDNNSVPELIINVYDTQYVFTYKNGKIKTVSSFFYQYKLHPFAYFKKKGIYCAAEFLHDISSFQYCTLKKGKSKHFATEVYNKGKFVGYRAVNGSSISSSSFQKLLRKKGGNGRLTVIQVNSFRKNTAANRNKYLK